MRLTDKDMDRADYWAFSRRATRAVDSVLPPSQSDRAAKARADAIDALTKALMVVINDPR